MHPAFSVIFLTTLIGAGQGLFLALFTGQFYASIKLIEPQGADFYALGSAVALVLLIAGLGASFFHLGRPERAWRAASKWRTSWLSREVIVLPMMMAVVFFYGLFHWMGWTEPFYVAGGGTLPIDVTLVLGFIGILVAFALFVCTAMIYASVKFLRNGTRPTPWATSPFSAWRPASCWRPPSPPISATIWSASTAPGRSSSRCSGWPRAPPR
jgi:DMSO reductase anchor subunit